MKQIRPLKNFSSTRLGTVEVPLLGEAAILTTDDKTAQVHVDAGLCEYVNSDPKPTGSGLGQARPSVSSPAAPVSPSSNANTPEADAESSPSIPATSESRGVTESTHVTVPGGKSTSKTSRRKRKGSPTTTGS